MSKAVDIAGTICLFCGDPAQRKPWRRLAGHGLYQLKRKPPAYVNKINQRSVQCAINCRDNTSLERDFATLLQDLFFAPEDLYRLGNSASARLTNVRRPKDIDTKEINGTLIVTANGKGVSLFTKDRLDKTPMSGWVWKITKGTQLPAGLKLLNDRPGHYSICPRANMPLDEFIGLLSKLALKSHKVFKKEAMQ